MSYLYVWQAVPINKSSRPILAEGEYSIYVKDNVGMYQGKLKLPSYQNGRVYLTNKRIIYIDSVNLQKAIAFNLKDASRAEYVEKFLRSSPKVKVYIKIDEDSGSAKPTSTQQLTSSLPAARQVDWTCVICSFNNHLLTSTDLDREFPKCVSCGIPPSRTMIGEVLKKAQDDSESPDVLDAQEPQDPHQCPKCTFINHPLMRYCELCGTELRNVSLALAKKIQELENAQKSGLEAQNPLGIELEEREEYTLGKPYIKVSFRKGGDLAFYEHVIQEIDKLKWANLESRGKINGEATKVKENQPVASIKTAGIHSLEQYGQQQRKRNELILTQSLEDLEQLMYKAQDLIKLSLTFGSLVKRKKAPTSAVPIPPLIINRTLSLYHQELARHISEYLLNFELTKITSMITIPDLFASYNRFQISNLGFGTDLLSTQDLTKSLEMLDKLQLPVKLTTFQSGLQVVTQRSHELQDIHVTIMNFLVERENQFWFEKLQSEITAESDEYTKKQFSHFHGVTVAEIAEHFGWSHTVCIEEMELCTDEALVVFDKHILGVFYFVNQFDEKLAKKLKSEHEIREEVEKLILAQQKDISSILKTRLDLGQNLVSLTSENGILTENNSDVESAMSSNSVSRSNLQLSQPSSLGDLAGLQFT